MKVSEILNLYLKATGGAADAHDERWQHLNHAHEVISHALELPELYVPNAEVTTTAARDWIEMDCAVYSIQSVQDKATGSKLNPEPGGFGMRARYLEAGTTRPPFGLPGFYIRNGNRIYLRDTPEEVRTLLISFRAQPPEWGDDSYDDHPVTPSQYDMDLIKLATASYYELHPSPLPDGGMDYQRAQILKSQVMQSLSGRQPAADEDRDRRNQWTTQRGYDFGVWGR